MIRSSEKKGVKPFEIAQPPRRLPRIRAQFNGTGQPLVVPLRQQRGTTHRTHESSKSALQLAQLSKLRAGTISSGSSYLAALFICITVTFAVHYVSRISAIGEMDYIRLSESISIGRPLSLLVGGVGASVTTLLWLKYRPTCSWTANFNLFFLLIGATWVSVTVLSLTQDSPFDVSSLGVPLVMVMIWAKPVPLRVVLRAIDLWAMSVVGLSITYLVLQWAELVVTSDNVYVYLRRWEIVTPFGTIIERWAGPFGNVNFSGPLGAVILVYGITRSGIVRRVSVVGGLLILVLSESRSAFGAAIIGVATLILIRLTEVKGRHRIVSAGVAALAALPLAGLFLLDTDLNGRTPLWADYLKGWWEQPILGVRSLGGIGTSGHNVFIDTAYQFGLVGLIPILCVFAVLSIMVAPTLRQGPAYALPMMATLIFSFSMERLIDLRYLTPQIIPLLIVALGASAFRVNSGRSNPQESQWGNTLSVSFSGYRDFHSAYRQDVMGLPINGNRSGDAYLKTRLNINPSTSPIREH